MISLFVLGMVVMFGAVVTIVTTAFVTVFFLQKEIRDRYKDAAKVVIGSKDASVVHVNIYDQDNKKIQELEIKSETGVDSSISEGQTYKV